MLIPQKSLIALSVVSCVILTGCGGGGGSSATLSPFTSWGAVQPNSSVTVPGISQSGTYRYDSVSDRVTERTLGASTDGASYSATYDSNGFATAVSITPAGGSTISWSRSAGDTFGVLIANNNVDAVVSADETRYALAANPFAYDWDYQSFGVWATGGGTGSGTYGAISVGSATAGASIPTSGAATFLGASGGRYVNNSGQYFFTSSSMSAATNFAARTVNFSTTNTQVSEDLLSFSVNNNLNIAGNLNYSAATNLITGNVTTTGGLTGTVNARFYGPSAQEIGGTFAVTPAGGGLEGYAGAFGGRRP